MYTNRRFLHKICLATNSSINLTYNICIYYTHIYNNVCMYVNIARHIPHTIKAFTLTNAGHALHMT